MTKTPAVVLAMLLLAYSALGARPITLSDPEYPAVINVFARLSAIEVHCSRLFSDYNVLSGGMLCGYVADAGFGTPSRVIQAAYRALIEETELPPPPYCDHVRRMSDCFITTSGSDPTVGFTTGTNNRTLNVTVYLEPTRRGYLLIIEVWNSSLP